MTHFEIGILVGLVIIVALLWDIRSAARKIHDLIIDEKIDRMRQGR